MSFLNYIKRLFGIETNISNEEEIMENNSQLTARELMDSGSKLLVLFEDFDEERIINTFLSSGCDVLLVCGKSIDDVKGYFTIHNALHQLYNNGKLNLLDVKPVKHIAPSSDLIYILSLMRTAQEPIIVVSNEFGGTEGIISKNTIINNIYENHTANILIESDLNNGEIILNGKTPIWKLKSLLNINLDDYTCETVGGFVLEYFQTLPKIQDTFNFHGYKFTVLEINKNFITKISLSRNLLLHNVN